MEGKTLDFGILEYILGTNDDNDTQTRQYKSPKVMFGSKYSTYVDMWPYACICFEVATGGVLFDLRNGTIAVGIRITWP